MENKIKRVWWYDITAKTWTIPKKPYKNYLAECCTIGEVIKDKDCVIVIYSTDNKEDDKCFDVIPRSVVTRIEDIKF